MFKCILHIKSTCEPLEAPVRVQKPPPGREDVGLRRLFPQQQELAFSARKEAWEVVTEAGGQLWVTSASWLEVQAEGWKRGLPQEHTCFLLGACLQTPGPATCGGNQLAQASSCHVLPAQRPWLGWWSSQARAPVLKPQNHTCCQFSPWLPCSTARPSG